MNPDLHGMLQAQHDLAYQQMLAAWRGDPETWRGVNVSLRDGIVDYAVGRSLYYQRTIAPGTPFEAIPILTKALIREHLDKLLAHGVPAGRRFPDTTSGSTGEPLSFYRDTAQLLIEESAAERFLRSLHGVPFEVPMVKIVSTGRRTRIPNRLRLLSGGPRPQSPLSEYRVPIATLRPGDVPGEIRNWSRLGDYFLTGNASGIHWIAEQIHRRSIPIPRRPTAIATIADTLTEHARDRIRETFGAPVHTRYASTEFRRIAASLPGTIDRYVFNPLLVHVEILDAHGRPLPPGATGRLIITDLNNMVMPMIRYDTGDLAVASVEGSIGGFPLVERILGRISEVVNLPSGKMLSGVGVGGHVIRRANLGRWVRFYQCAQTGPNELELRVVWDGNPRESVRARMAEALQSIADPDTVVRVVDIDELERLPSGKVWIVRRELGAAGSPTGGHDAR